jgi:two-component system, response regulator YesN
MERLLIVEDEKMIRQGIYAMVLRSPVQFNEIIMCKNGEEAYEVVKNQRIDIMITDIRMPKMDGITLVREIQSLEHVPKVVVISGYDDFSYAVELLRCGAKEYILKPVEREKINQILLKLQKEIEQEKEQVNDIVKIGYQQFKYMLLNNSISEAEITSIENKFKECFINGQYVVCCTNCKTFQEMDRDDVILLNDIQGQSVFIIKSSSKDDFLSNTLKNHFVGISREHKSIRELREAYEEALYARKNAFATGSYITQYKQPVQEKEIISDEMLDQFVQMIGTDKLANAKKLLDHILYKTKQGLIDPDHFSQAMNSIVDKICMNYKNLLDFDVANKNQLKSVYEYDNAGCYYETFSNWIGDINEKLVTQFDDYKNKQKIQKAVTYIHENYNKDLNMAVVSNHISMNYSLFSYVFKQYTGMNFVNYLKSIRISEAKRLLEETDYKIIEISNKVGYENEKHFMKTFRSVCGVSPSEFRKNVQVGKHKI